MQTAKVVWTGGQKFRATSPSGHTIHLDSDRATNEGPGPMELLLMALGACTATDIVIIMETKRQKVDWLEVICSGVRGANRPTVWTKLEFLFCSGGSLLAAGVKH